MLAATLFGGKMKKTLFFVLLLFAVCICAQEPDWLWAENAGGIYDDSGQAISIDADGNSYVTGYFMEIASFGSFNLTSNGGSDIFIAKMDTNGNWLWAESAGGNNYDKGIGITTDDDGNIYVVGRFIGTASFGSFNIISNGGFDIFIAKMDPNGCWLWVESVGGSETDEGNGIITDDTGNIYVTGCFEETASFGSFDLNSSGGRDIFIAKMDTNGNWLWAVSAGGNYWDEGLAINTDVDGNVLVTGYYWGLASFGPVNLTSNGNYDMFILKIESEGNWLWAISAGGDQYDFGRGIITDDTGNIYVTGFFEETASFGSFDLNSSGVEDIFIAKIDTNGNWQWAISIGGSYWDEGRAISIDNYWNIFITGTFGISSSDCGIFVAKIDVNGNLLWVESASGSFGDVGNAISTFSDGNVYVTGAFRDLVGFGTFNITSNGSWDIFVAKITNNTFTENELFSTEMEFFNYPNPFNPTTTISFSITEESNVELSIYNIKGQKIKSLLNDQITAGEHSIVWYGTDASGKKVASSVYLYRLNVNGKIEAVKKCLLVK